MIETNPRNHSVIDFYKLCILLLQWSLECELLSTEGNRNFWWGKRPTLLLYFLGFFWGDGGGLELFVIKFASQIVDYCICIPCGVESAQLSHSAIALCWVEEIT